MPETDVLNPTPAWQEDIQDSMCPNYGFKPRRVNTQLHKKAIGGTPWTRETQNTGHSFQFSWLSRSWACVQRLRQYYEQYEDGYFTIIDWDGGGRNYVGRFTTDIAPEENANGMWDVQNVTFEEMPTVPMLTYPTDWEHDAIFFGVNNDFGDQKLATSGAWNAATLGAAPTPTLGGIERTNLTTAYMTDPGTTSGDWAQYEYRGYGFQLYLLQGPAFGIANVLLDGVQVATVDCYAEANNGAVMLLSQPSVSLDIHRVQLVTTNTKNASSSAPAIGWYGLVVMR